MIPALASTLVGQLSSLTGARASASTAASTLLDTAQQATQDKGKVHHFHGHGLRTLSDQLQSTLLQQQSDQTTAQTGLLQSDDVGQTAANLG
jgi:hypothetical protein